MFFPMWAAIMLIILASVGGLIVVFCFLVVIGLIVGGIYDMINENKYLKELDANKRCPEEIDIETNKISQKEE